MSLLITVLLVSISYSLGLIMMACLVYLLDLETPGVMALILWPVAMPIMLIRVIALPRREPRKDPENG